MKQKSDNCLNQITQKVISEISKKKYDPIEKKIKENLLKEEDC